jgi:hypothetical protein
MHVTTREIRGEQNTKQANECRTISTASTTSATSKTSTTSTTIIGLRSVDWVVMGFDGTVEGDGGKEGEDVKEG